MGESELFTSAVRGAVPTFESGYYGAPTQVGLGATLDQQVLSNHPYAPVSGGLDPSLG